MTCPKPGKTPALTFVSGGARLRESFRSPNYKKMPRAHGRFPREYISNPNVQKPIEEIYADINGFTWELFHDDEGVQDNVDFNVILPPLTYEGRLVKGLYFSRGVDYLREMFTGLDSIFLSVAYTMFCSYPWAKSADAYLSCYQNLEREAWYQRLCPARKAISFIPLGDTDYLDEYRFSSVVGERKDIDVLCVSRLHDVKNIEMIARALRIYRSKYRQRLRVVLVTGHRNGIALELLPTYAQVQLRKLRQILGRVEDFIELTGYVDHWKELPRLYSRARMYLLGSLIEGKNRGINEAQSCNVPVVCFREFNNFARQGHPIFGEAGGACSASDAEALADTIYFVLTNPELFSARLEYLKHYGRRNFVNRCLDSIPYYVSNLPEFISGQHMANPWVDVAMQHAYGKDLHSFLYHPGRGVARAWGLEQIRRMLEFYRGRIDEGSGS
jgi:glycosyltransferase involved in cell wall biosynthesis